MSAADVISGVVREARLPGEALRPSALLGLLSDSGKLPAAMSDLDQANQFFDALYTEFSFIRSASGGGVAINAVELSKWAALLRWLVRELRHWRSEDDINRVTLTACFVVSQASDHGDILWSALPNDFANNAELSEVLKRSISTLTIQFPMHHSKTSISESQAVERLRCADTQRDWYEIAESWRPFEDTPLSNFYITQAVRCLLRSGIHLLVEAVTDVSQTAQSMMIAAAVPIAQRLELAIATANQYVQFGAIYQALSRTRSAKHWHSKHDALLKSLLLKVSTDQYQWAAWMRIFNAYPSRYPNLQTPLGHALAHMPEGTIKQYVSSIVLHAAAIRQDLGRKSVAQCLRAFRSSASMEQRQTLWKAAHDRWRAWYFDRDDPNAHVLGIQGSTLDFAIVAFGCECMDVPMRKAAQDDIRLALQHLDEVWHTSETAMRAEWDRLLSRFQPYSHASSALKAGEDWLQEAKTYLPFDPAEVPYLIAKYGTRQP